MRRVISSVVLLGLMLIGSGPALHAQKGKKKDADDDTKNTPKLIKSGVFVGKVQAVYEDKRRLRIQVSYPVMKPNPGAASGIFNAQRSLQQASAQYQYAISRRDPNGAYQAQQQMYQAQRQLMQAQARMYTVQMVNKDVEVHAIDEVVVRVAKPKEQFNEKGDRIKKYTKKELKELKGNPKLPGYKAEFADIGTEQIVRVTTVRKKGEPIKAPRKGKKGKDDDGLADGLIDDLPQASMIEILREPPPTKG